VRICARSKIIDAMSKDFDAANVFDFVADVGGAGGSRLHAA
jgi:hypothetical protein